MNSSVQSSSVPVLTPQQLKWISRLARVTIPQGKGTTRRNAIAVQYEDLVSPATLCSDSNA